MTQNKNTSSEYSWIIEAITEEPQMPMLTLINNFGGKDSKTLDFSETLENIQKELHHSLTICLEKNLGPSLDAFFEVDNLKPEIELLHESEQYLADGMKHSLENFRTTIEEYNQLVRAKQNLDDVISEVKQCLEMVREFQKVEKLAADNEFYRAALTMERLRVRIATLEESYQFVGRLKEALDKLSANFTQEVIESICRFLLQLSHKLQDIGKDVLDHGWACDPYKYVDFTELAHAKFIAKTFSFEDQLDASLQVQADLLLTHVCKSATGMGTEQFCQQILGFFVALIATASIAEGATFFMTSLWESAMLQTQSKIDSILDDKQITTSSQCEQIIISLVELIKFSQWYCLPSHLVEFQMEQLFNHFCCFYMQDHLDKIKIAETSDSVSIFGHLKNKIDCVDLVESPAFENQSLNSEKLVKFWEEKKSRILRKVIIKVLARMIQSELGEISRESKMFGKKICAIWDELTQIHEKSEFQSLDFFKEELLIQKESLKNVLRCSVECNLKTVFQVLSGRLCNLDEILSESSNNQSGALFDLAEWLKDETQVYSNHPELLQESVITFLQLNLAFVRDIFWYNPTIKLEHLDSLEAYTQTTLPVVISSFKDESYLISTETGLILELMTLLGSGDYTSKAAAILDSLAKLSPDQFTVPLFVSRLGTLKDNTNKDKIYAKSKRGKEELKMLNNLIKAVNKLKK